MTEPTNATPTENQDAAAAAAAPAAPKAAAKGKAKVVRLRSLVGPFTILHTNTVIGEGEEKKVEIDAWVQLQIDAKKLEIVTD
jgi:hypothetical protein